ncbi:MAG: hypothetical protein M1818_007407 [Claussenomyces sp. TS43310]|nr:MAG: hypothetical protein M1818_007407 [Claussenomyces sp. TS43310]
MLIRSHGYTASLSSPALARDVLRIEVVGDTGLSLTVVDLPAVIANANEEQTEQEMKLVTCLIDSYLRSPRTIILAVIQTDKYNLNQGIIQQARMFDKDGHRTFKFMAEQYLVDKGTEGSNELLSNNQDLPTSDLSNILLKDPKPDLRNAWIFYKNCRPHQSESSSVVVWEDSELDMAPLDQKTLRAFVHNLLDEHIENELPNVREEVRKLLKETQKSLDTLGDARTAVRGLRAFLTRISMSFQGLIKAALDGDYTGAENDFFDQGDLSFARHLRAEIYKLDEEFANHMRTNGKKRKLFPRGDSESGAGFDSESESDFEPDSNSGADDDGPLQVTKEEFYAWVREVYLRTKGRDLPGTYNHVLIAALFREQSSRWSKIASDHVEEVFETIAEFFRGALEHVIGEESVRDEVRKLTFQELELAKVRGRIEFGKILEDEKRHPVIHNHHYTARIQKARLDCLKLVMKDALKGVVDEEWKAKFHIGTTSAEAEKLLASLQKQIVVDTDHQVCTEALAALNTYYKLSLKTFVDNVCRQVIERHLLSGLPNIFSPHTVANMSDDELRRIAWETPKQQEHRAALGALAQRLQDSLDYLEK